MHPEVEDIQRIKEDIEKLTAAKVNEEDALKLVDKVNTLNSTSPTLRWISVAIAFVVIFGVWLTNEFLQKTPLSLQILSFLSDIFNHRLYTFILVGLCAQLVDGALGMAYGATCTSFLLSLGITPAVASASVHIAEVFTTGASGISHLKFGNVNRKLFLYLLVPGMLGAILGAYLISDVINGKYIKPFMALYMMILGIIILKKALNKVPKRKSKTKNLGFLAFFGGFMDAIGGGGWGPIVTSTLVSKGRSANYTIGSVNLAEFFIALAGAGTFVLFLEIDGWQTIIGLILGGVLAAPFAAFLVSKIKRKTLMIGVAILVISLSIRTIFLTDFKQLWNALLELFV